MESIPNDPYFEFRPNTLQDVRKEFNLHQPGAMDELIKHFEEWIEKQNHFTKKSFSYQESFMLCEACSTEWITPPGLYLPPNSSVCTAVFRLDGKVYETSGTKPADIYYREYSKQIIAKHFLEASIILSKGSLEKAKKSLDKLCTLRTLIPNFFSKQDIKKEMVDFTKTMTPLFLPKLTDDNYRIFILKIVSNNIDNQTWCDYYTTIMLMCEYMKAHDYTQGFCAIIDFRLINVMNFAMSLNLLDMRDMFTAMLEGYGMRIKAIHYISDSKAIDAMVTVIKQVVSEKISKRVHVHKTIESVYDHVDKDLLPEDYGGKEKPFLEIYDDFINVLSREKNVEYFKDICQSGTDEACRHTTTYNNDILGMPGSFRTLNVD